MSALTNSSPSDAPGYRKDLRARRAEFILIVAVATLMATYCWIARSPPHFGDGFEYLSMSEAFVRHASPDVRLDDLQALLRNNPDDDFIRSYGGGMIEHFQRGDGNVVFSRGHDSRFYSYHFWLYPLLNAPALALCQLFGSAPRNSFLLTNALLFLGMVALVAFAPDWRMRRKLLLILLAAGCGATFYFPVASPESMCFSLSLAGLVLLETRRYGWALLVFAVAAQQNPPIALLALAAGSSACWQAGLEWRAGGSVAHAARSLSRLVPGAIMLIASPLFYLVEFGSPSLIVKAGGSDLALISGYRLASLFFDANQGMVLAMPGVFLALVVLCAVELPRPRRSTWVALALVAGTMLMAIPAMTSTNWNSDCVIILRYAHWLSAPLLYACALLFDAVGRGAIAAVGALALLATQAGLLAGYKLRGGIYSYTQPSPLAAWLLKHHPQWYRPVPEIFVERGLHGDGNVLRDGYSYLYVRGGRMREMLTQGDRLFALNSLCHAGNQNLPKQPTELGWRYWNLKKYCPLDWPDGFYAMPDKPAPLVMGKPNSLGASANYVSSLLPGLGKPEKWGTWTVQRLAVVPLVFPETGRFVPRWRVSLTFSTYLQPRIAPVQHVMLWANGREVIDLHVSKSTPQPRNFIAEARPWVHSQGVMLLEFHIPTAVSHKELGLSGDSRRMGIGLIAIEVTPLTDDSSASAQVRPYTSSSRTMSSSPR